MTSRTLRWATGGVAALSIALLLGGLPLAYLGRHVAPAGLWNFPDVFEELTFVAVPVVGFVLVSRRPANKIGWTITAHLPLPAVPAGSLLRPATRAASGTRSLRTGDLIPGHPCARQAHRRRSVDGRRAG
jgi:hypothetical protein